MPVDLYSLLALHGDGKLQAMPPRLCLPSRSAAGTNQALHWIIKTVVIKLASSLRHGGLADFRCLLMSPGSDTVAKELIERANQALHVFSRCR